MTFRHVFTFQLPTLALVALGASELQVGLQGSFIFAFVTLQLPTLRVLTRVSKRRVLVGAHAFALVAALPLVFFDRLAELPQAAAIALAQLAFALVAAAICVGETVWFPLLYAYLDRASTGRFFGLLRTGWHLALILFFAGSQWWLAQHPGSFAPLFAFAWGLGALRIFLIVRMPERWQSGGARVRVRDALALVREPVLRRYLATVAWGNAWRVTATVFGLVMFRRAVGLSEGEAVGATIAFYAGGLASLMLWGRIVDRAGALPVLRITAVGKALVMALLAVAPASALSAEWFALWFFSLAALAAGFGVADTHWLFELTPAEAPAATIVIGAVAVGLAAGVAPVLAGAALDLVLPADPAGAVPVYRGFFALLALLEAAACWPTFGLPARRA
jgi:MFS family permease